MLNTEPFDHPDDKTRRDLDELYERESDIEKMHKKREDEMIASEKQQKDEERRKREEEEQAKKFQEQQRRDKQSKREKERVRRQREKTGQALTVPALFRRTAGREDCDSDWADDEEGEGKRDRLWERGGSPSTDQTRPATKGKRTNEDRTPPTPDRVQERKKVQRKDNLDGVREDDEQYMTGLENNDDEGDDQGGKSEGENRDENAKEGGVEDEERHEERNGDRAVGEITDDDGSDDGRSEEEEGDEGEKAMGKGGEMTSNNKNESVDPKEHSEN